MIVLVSDGDDPAEDGEWRTAYAVARAAQIPVFIIGIGDPARDSSIPFGDASLTFHGTPVLTRLHEDPLREIATRTRGTYVTAGTAKPDLAGFVRDTLNQFPTREAIAGTLPQPAPRQLWFLLPALVLLLILIPLSAAIRAGGRARQMAAAAALVFIGAASVSDTELRRGIASLDAGKLDQALVHFAAAAERATDPGLVAFNEGIALYRLDRFREAEARFRWALSDAEGARRASALYNLGCALLQSSQGRRAEPLKHAVVAFEQALASADLKADIRGMARDNLELAKRLLARLPPESPNAPPGTGPEEPAPPSGSDAANPGGTERAAVADRARNDKSLASAPQVTDRPPPPGKGSLPPLPDDDALAPLTPEDARAHLDRAAARIAAARATQLRTHAATPSTQFPDW
jgi:tetratricopeptide (TPR) repeat protein